MRRRTCQLPELRKELHKLVITDQEISETFEEYDIPIFMLTLDDAKFDKLDMAAIAKLHLDSRYRFDLKEPDHVRCTNAAQRRAAGRYESDDKPRAPR